MALIRKATSILKRLKRDESGIAALSWALSLTAIIGAMGAAMDMAMLISADARSQTVADTTALAAAIYMKNYEQLPANRDEGLIGDYTADELGYEYRNWVVDGAKGVKVNISYDNVKREATALVSGYTNPTLMQILGFSELKFQAKTVVKYFEKDIQDPASVLLILDNSGSMAFDDLPIDPSTGNSPTEAVRRMDGLIAGADKFLNMLDDTVGPQLVTNSEPRVLRTGMLAFDSEIISDRTVQMDWGTIPRGSIKSMTPKNATDSTPPLTLANTWLNVNEPTQHALENPGKTPLKYVILMTDGKNSGDLKWVDRSGTENWRRYVTNATSSAGLSNVESEEVEVKPKSCSTDLTDRWNYVCDYSDSDGNNWRKSYGPYETKRSPDSGSYSYKEGRGRKKRKVNVTYNCASESTTPAETQTCTPAETETRYSGYMYHQGETPPDTSGDWKEGEFDVPANISSRAQCDALHEANVEVFTIGFALVPGQFETNEWANRPGAYSPSPRNSDYSYSDSVESTNLAKGMLQYCASKDENFITADDVTALEVAFDRIGNTIIKEIIRISS